MTSNRSITKEFMEKIIDTPELIGSEEAAWALDEILTEIIAIEKRHTFQVEGSTVNARRAQLRKHLDTLIKDVV